MTIEKYTSGTEFAPQKAHTFWRAYCAGQGQHHGDAKEPIRFDAGGNLGILASPIATGLLCVLLYAGPVDDAQARVSVPSAIGPLSLQFSGIYEVDPRDIHWLYVASDGIVHFASLARNASGRIVSVRISPLNAGAGKADLRDVCAVYGREAALLVRAAAMNFPQSMPRLLQSLPES